VSSYLGEAPGVIASNDTRPWSRLNLRGNLDSHDPLDALRRTIFPDDTSASGWPRAMDSDFAPFQEEVVIPDPPLNWEPNYSIDMDCMNQAMTAGNRNGVEQDPRWNTDPEHAYGQGQAGDSRPARTPTIMLEGRAPIAEPYEGRMSPSEKLQ
jgi:hypothetical protein